MGREDRVELDPPGNGVGAVRRECTGLSLEEAVSVERDLAMEQRVVLVEPNEVDLRRGHVRERRRQRELFTQRKLEVDRKDGNVEIASRSSSARCLRAEEHGEAQGRAARKSAAQLGDQGGIERHSVQCTSKATILDGDRGCVGKTRASLAAGLFSIVTASTLSRMRRYGLLVGCVIAVVGGVPVVACSTDTAADDPSTSSGGPGGDAGGDGSSQARLDGSTSADGDRIDDGATADGADGALPAPPLPPIVGPVSGFGKVLTQTVEDLACSSAHCWGAASQVVVDLPTGATTASPMPTFPWGTTVGTFGIWNLATFGTQLYVLAEHNPPGDFTDFTTEMVVLGAGTWTRIGAARHTVPLRRGTMATDGKAVYVGVSAVAGGGVASIAVNAGPNDAWTSHTVGQTETGLYPVIDRQGTLWAVFNGSQTYRIPAGETAWVPVGSAWTSGAGYGRRLSLAPNGDLWFSGISFVGKLAAGATAWSAIGLPATGDTSAVVIDGSNTAYFTLGSPQKLMKVAPGATTATDTGVVLTGTPPCGPAAIDGAGKLLFSCVIGAGSDFGVFRSTP